MGCSSSTPSHVAMPVDYGQYDQQMIAAKQRISSSRSDQNNHSNTNPFADPDPLPLTDTSSTNSAHSPPVPPPLPPPLPPPIPRWPSHLDFPEPLMNYSKDQLELSHQNPDELMAQSRNKVFERDVLTSRSIEELKRIYKEKILPLEQLHRFDLFSDGALLDAEFDANPQVMLVGQYSVGKTSFIKYLIGKDFPGSKVGPEPTTDKFVAVFDGPDDRLVPGNALAVANNHPYKGLERFGMDFLNHFEGAQTSSDFLKNVTIIDTPGMLSGEKQKKRGYDYEAICRWFAQRCDMILILFDVNKVDISDEMKSIMQCFKLNDEKVRIILNKSDLVDRQQIVRIYGSLLWSFGRVYSTPEVMRVYVGSFWDQPLFNTDNARLFEMEHADLMNDLKGLPKSNAMKKINELVRRAKSVKVHSVLLGHLKDQMPAMFGHKKKQAELIADMKNQFTAVHKLYGINQGDFPDINNFCAGCRELDFELMNKSNPQMIADVDKILGVEFPRLMDFSIDDPLYYNYISDPSGKTERILASGMFDKKSGSIMVGFQPRHLILTDKPRLYYIDMEKKERKGTIEWTSNSPCRATVLDSTSFSIVSKSPKDGERTFVFRICDTNKYAELDKWVGRINKFI